MAENRNLYTPGDETAGWDEVEVFFRDGTSTLVWVSEDDNIGEAVAELCDHEGWDTKDVVNTTIKR
jgi:hypothetical protein